MSSNPHNLRPMARGFPPGRKPRTRRACGFLARSLAAGVIMFTAAQLCAAGVPEGYVEVARDEWRWATRLGGDPPPVSRQRLIESALRDFRARLALPKGRAPLFVYASDHGSFRKIVTDFAGAAPEEWTLGVTFGASATIVLDGERLEQTSSFLSEEVILHEIVHVLLAESAGEIPRWYHEGLAQWMSGKRVSPAEAEHVGALIMVDHLLSFEELDRFFPETHRESSTLYTQSLLFVDFLTIRHGEAVHGKLLRALRAGSSFPAGFKEATGVTLAEAELLWRARARADFSWWAWLVHSVGMWPILALGVIVGFVVQKVLRRRQLARMESEESGEPDDDSSGPAPNA